MNHTVEHYDDYLAAKAEARACGDFDFPTFHEWNAESDRRATAESKYRALTDRDELDLH